jgi:hypothetical protein
VITYRRILILVSLVTGLAFLSATTYFVRQDERRNTQELHAEILSLRTTYEVHLAELERNLVNLAQMLASEPEVVRLLHRAATLPDPADDPGREETLDAIRESLRTVLEPRWQVLRDELGIRQLQLVTPDLVSLLRLHAPGEHGDALDEVRPLLAATARKRVPQSGFEIGRAFAGLRGAVPVMIHPAGSPPKLIGVLELGALLDGPIDRLTPGPGRCA